jgi:hypothetical protein
VKNIHVTNIQLEWLLSLFWWDLEKYPYSDVSDAMSRKMYIKLWIEKRINQQEGKDFLDAAKREGEL